MPVNLDAWFETIKQAVRGIADEKLQHRAWLGSGPEVFTPSEMFNQFFSDAAVEEFFKRDDINLSQRQLEAGRHLVKLMRQLSDAIPNDIERDIGSMEFIKDPRLAKCREAATVFLDLLKDTGSVKPN